MRLLQLRVEQRRFEPCDDLALLDDRVEVGAEPLMLPDTWLPTCTVVTAWSVPVAPTASMMSPRVERRRLDLDLGARRAGSTRRQLHRQ